MSFHKIAFSKTHDIGALLSYVQTVDAELARMLGKTEILSKFAVSIRYPASHGEEILITKIIADDCIALAEATFIEISSRLK